MQIGHLISNIGNLHSAEESQTVEERIIPHFHSIISLIQWSVCGIFWLLGCPVPGGPNSAEYIPFDIEAILMELGQ